MRKLLFGLSIIFFILITQLILGLSQSSQAPMLGNNTSTWVPLPTVAGDELPSWAATKNAMLVAKSLELDSKSIDDYNVVYLTSEIQDQQVTSLTSSSQFLKYATKAHIAYSWQEVETFHRDHPLNALIIHASAVDIVDKEWVQAAYRNGVVITGVNLFFGQMSDLTANKCIYPDAYVSPHKGDYFVSYYYVVKTQDESETGSIHHNQLTLCGDAETNGMYRTRGGYEQNHLENEDDLSRMFQVIKSQVFRSETLGLENEDAR